MYVVGCCEGVAYDCSGACGVALYENRCSEVEKCCVVAGAVV